MADTFTPYATVRPYVSGAAPTHVSGDDAERVQAYLTYEEMYWGASQAGVEVQDGTPISVPVSKIIVEAVHRFLAVGWDFNVVGNDPGEAAKLAFTKLFKREQVKAKVSTAKRYGLIRGDALLHIVADPLKPEGSRISIEEVDPSSYFPIYDVDDPQHILGCHLINILVNEEGKEYVRRQTYRKEVDANGIPTGVITTQLATFETTGWDDRFDAKPETIKQLDELVPETPLPAQITAIPVYHWKNTRNPADIFGSSLMRGIEKALKSVDQTITDEDLALALASLGVYATDSGAPEDGAWVIGPGRVVEVKNGSFFNRVPGITTVDPSIAHATYLENKARAGAGVPAIAVGDVDVPSAESGIALALKLMPLLAANAERELEILSVLDHMLFDLQTMWFPAYEATSFPDTLVIESIIKDAMPINRDAVVAETILLLTNGTITMRMAIAKLRSLGWEYTPEDVNELQQLLTTTTPPDQTPPADQTGAQNAPAA